MENVYFHYCRAYAAYLASRQPSQNGWTTHVFADLETNERLATAVMIATFDACKGMVPKSKADVLEAVKELVG